MNFCQGTHCVVFLSLSQQTNTCKYKNTYIILTPRVNLATKWYPISVFILYYGHFPVL